MEALKTIPYIFLILAVAGIIAGASVLSISKFGSTMTQCTSPSAVYANDDGSLKNGTLQTGANQYACVNSSYTGRLVVDGTYGNYTDESYKSTILTNQGMSTVAGQFSTIGIIAIMVIIISLISGVFAYLAYFK